MEGHREGRGACRVTPTPLSLPGFPGTEEPGGLQSMGSQRVRHDLATERACTQTERFPCPSPGHPDLDFSHP